MAITDFPTLIFDERVDSPRPDSIVKDGVIKIKLQENVARIVGEYWHRKATGRTIANASGMAMPTFWYTYYLY